MLSFSLEFQLFSDIFCAGLGPPNWIRRRPSVTDYIFYPPFFFYFGPISYFSRLQFSSSRLNSPHLITTRDIRPHTHTHSKHRKDSKKCAGGKFFYEGNDEYVFTLKWVLGSCTGISSVMWLLGSSHQSTKHLYSGSGLWLVGLLARSVSQSSGRFITAVEVLVETVALLVCLLLNCQ